MILDPHASDSVFSTCLPELYEFIRSVQFHYKDYQL